MRLSPVLLVTALLSAAFAAPLVPGDPPLEEAQVQQFAAFMGQVVQTPLAPADVQRVRASLIQTWKTGTDEERQGTLELLESVREVAKLPAAERELVGDLLERSTRLALYAQPEDADARHFLALYEKKNPVLVRGSVPLEQAAVNALVGIFSFQLSEAYGQKVTPSQADLEAFAQEMQSGYDSLSPEDQQTFYFLPWLERSLVYGWSQASDADRAETRKGWRDGFDAQRPAAQAPEAAPSSASTPTSGTQSLLAMQNQLAMQNFTFQTMSNIMASQHQTNMIIASNIGGNTRWCYSSYC